MIRVETKATIQHMVLTALGGVFLIALAAGLVYVAYQYFTTSSLPPYNYKITQTVSNSVTYSDSSFFEDGPTTEDTAYLMDLTDQVKAQFNYAYSGDAFQQVAYTYRVDGTVRSVYGLEGNDSVSNVWTEHMTIVEPTTKASAGGDFSISQPVAIPFQEYRTLAEQFRTGLGLPVNTEAYVEMTVSVEGEYQGSPFTDTQKSRVTVPLNMQIYQPKVAFEKEVIKDVEPTASADRTTTTIRYALLGGAALLFLIGAFAIIFGLRKQLFKSQYQRELERIYRYHEGIIIRAGRRVRFTGKQVVPVGSFDDILNLEEELKAPIIASTLDTQSTQFILTSGDVAYVYTLGETITAQDEIVDDVVEQETQTIESVVPAKKAPAKHRPVSDIKPRRRID